VANALQPAKVREVRVDPDTQTAQVIVPDYQLSLAIGREGQNARLAARLTGWRIDIRSDAAGDGPAGSPGAAGGSGAPARPAGSVAAARPAGSAAPARPTGAPVRGSAPRARPTASAPPVAR